MAEPMKAVLALAAFLALSAQVQGHRLDEYLQATRLSVGLDRIDLAIDLTPGQAVSRQLLAAIDPQGSPLVPRNRLKQYARRVLEDLTLELDGRRLALKLASSSFPARADMELGEGTIQLRLFATIPSLPSGPHEIRFQNNHLPAISVYLVNALLPENKTIRITRQIRDRLQTDYHLQFVAEER
jgi:hypothetical protein